MTVIQLVIEVADAVAVAINDCVAVATPHASDRGGNGIEAVGWVVYDVTLHIGVFDDGAVEDSVIGVGAQAV